MTWPAPKLLSAACSVVADASCNFESSACDWSVVRRVSHRDSLLDGDLLWHRHRRQLSLVGPVWDRSSTDGSVYSFMILYTLLTTSGSNGNPQFCWFFLNFYLMNNSPFNGPPSGCTRVSQ